ncbi:MAG: hypothetical protein RL684_895, partial [Pseudomonadota bacterium]
GIGLWSPRLPGWALACDVLHGRAAPPAAPQARVAPALLAPTERRRAPDTVAIALEAAARACEMAGVAPASIPSVFASTHGDLPISDYMCATLAGTPRLLSPTKFHNSVHNAAVGYWTIGTHCMQASTALTAWRNTFANGLLEAAVQAHADDTPVLLVAYDVTARGPMATVTHSDGLLAVALVLLPDGAARVLTPAAGFAPRHLRIALRAGTVGPSAAASNAGGAATVEPWAQLATGNAMLPCLPLMAALARADGASLRMDVGRGSHIDVQLQAAP